MNINDDIKAALAADDYEQVVFLASRELVRRADEAEARQGACATFALREGRYTVVLDDGHITFRVKTQAADAAFAPGQMLLERFVGGDEGRDHISVAFVSARGPNVWHKYRTDARLMRAIGILSSAPDAAAKEFAVQTGRCSRCGLELSTPRSMASLIGPDCAPKWGWDYVSAAEATRILAARKVTP